MCYILKRIDDAVCIIITWINTPLVSSVWMRSKLDEKVATKISMFKEFWECVNELKGDSP